MQNNNEFTPKDTTEQFEQKSILSQLPELHSVLQELIELRTKELEELKISKDNCQKIVDYSRNLAFENFATNVLAGINFSITKAQENLNQCSETLFIENQETLSNCLISLLHNHCLDHTINISGRLRNFSNQLSVFINNSNQRKDSLSLANECATVASSIAINFNNAKDYCTHYDEKIKFLIESLTKQQLELQIDKTIDNNIDSKNESSVPDKENQYQSSYDNDLCNNQKDNNTFIKKFKSIKRKLTLGVFLLPTLLVLAYSLIFYDSMYISNSEFVINSNSTENTLSLTPQNLLNGGMNNDIYIAVAYIKSLNMFNAIDKKLNLKKHFQSGDFISSLSSNATVKDIEEYWSNVVNVHIDLESELLRLSVRSYSPEFSLSIQKHILNELELLINQMNEKAHKDAISLAEKEVSSSEQEVEKTSLALKTFRDINTFISPEAEVSNFTNIIGRLEQQLSETKTELEQKLTYFKEDSLEIKTLKSKIDALNNQLNEVRTRIASNSTNKQILSNTINEYERLSLKHEFAKKKLESAMTSLEAARQISLTKARYLVMVESPTLPDESLWPTPFKSAFFTLILTILSGGIISLIISAIREHLGV
jgi:capsular polysaccharide transport system permease protein